MHRRAIATAVGDLAVAESGDGGRPLLLVHGFTGAKEDFAEWLDPLAGLGWHAVAVDLRGHGASAKPADEGDYSLDLFAEDVVAAADGLGWERFALLGHSMGGMVAQLVALSWPERLDALVLMGTGHGSVEGIDPALAAFAVDVVRGGGMAALDELLAGADGPLTTEADRRLRRERPGYEEEGRAKLLACAPAMYASMATRFLDQRDRLDALRGLDVPTLVIVGLEDRTFLEPSVRLADAVPGAELVVIPDAGHSPQFEAPAAFWDAVAAFTARLTGAGIP